MGGDEVMVHRSSTGSADEPPWPPPATAPSSSSVGASASSSGSQQEEEEAWCCIVRSGSAAASRSVSTTRWKSRFLRDGRKSWLEWTSRGSMRDDELRRLAGAFVASGGPGSTSLRAFFFFFAPLRGSR